MRVGDALMAASSTVGARPCAGCKSRAERLNEAFARGGLSPQRRGSGEEAAALGVRLVGSLAVGTFALALRRRIRN
jgi:hypothetical protein